MVASVAPYRGEIDLEAVFGWLSPDQWRLSYLSRTTEQQLELLKEFRDEENLPDAERLVQDILAVALNNGDPNEEGEARLRAAIVLYRLGGLRQAYDLLVESASRFGNRWHFYGAVQWLTGIVLIKIQNISKAMSALETGAEAFSDMRYESIIYKRWYRSRLDEMEAIMKRTNALGRYDHDIPGARYFYPQHPETSDKRTLEDGPQLDMLLAANDAEGVPFELIIRLVQALHQFERVYTQIFMAQSENPSSAIWYKGVLAPLFETANKQKSSEPDGLQKQVKSLFQGQTSRLYEHPLGSPLRIRRLNLDRPARIRLEGDPAILNFISESVSQFQRLREQREQLGEDAVAEVRNARWVLFHNQVKFIDRLAIPAALKKRLMKTILDDLAALAEFEGLTFEH